MSRIPPDDAALIAGVQAGDEDALAELYARHLPLLVAAARRHRVLPSDREALALEVIADVAMQLMRGDAPAPRNVAGVLVTALRRRVVDRTRREAARVTERPLHEARDAGVPPHDGATPPLARLAAHLEAHVDETELRILYWLGEHVPQRTIAAWLGVRPGAMRMRIARLRDRLRDVARTYWAALDDESRAELARSFHRWFTPPTISPPRRPGRTPGGSRHGTSA